MRYYYQYDESGDVGAIVKSNAPPQGVNQIAADVKYSCDSLKFNKNTKEIIFCKYTYDESGDVSGVVEDTDKSRVSIPDVDILDTTPVQQPAPNPQPAPEPAPAPRHDRP